MKTNNYVLVLVFLFFLFSFKLAAQNGQPVPCLDCEKYTQRTLPHQGLWYNVERPGTGLTIEAHKNVVVGTFYNFDSEGKQAWYLFSGELSPSEQNNTMWTLETNLKTYKNGECFNCEYTQAEIDTDQTQINIRFHQKGSASYSINGGEFTYVVPFVTGVRLEDNFTETTDYRMPDLRGIWTVTFDRLLSNGFGPKSYSDSYSYTARILDFDDEESLDDPNVMKRTYTLLYETRPFNDFTISTELICTSSKVNGQFQAPECLTNQLSLVGFGLRNFYFPVGNITHNRIFGETEDGETFEAVRTKYDPYEFNDNID